eukprot:9473104-Pyramimonas_sp.AAC.1
MFPAPRDRHLLLFRVGGKNARALTPPSSTSSSSSSSPPRGARITLPGTGCVIVSPEGGGEGGINN